MYFCFNFSLLIAIAVFEAAAEEAYELSKVVLKVAIIILNSALNRLHDIFLLQHIFFRISWDWPFSLSRVECFRHWFVHLERLVTTNNAKDKTPNEGLVTTYDTDCLIKRIYNPLFIIWLITLTYLRFEHTTWNRSYARNCWWLIYAVVYKIMSKVEETKVA